MKEHEIQQLLAAILLEDFNVSKEDFAWTKSLEALNSDFKLLGNFAKLEHSLSNVFKIYIPLLETIDVSFHTPHDVVKLIKNNTLT